MSLTRDYATAHTSLPNHRALVACFVVATMLALSAILLHKHYSEKSRETIKDFCTTKHKIIIATSSGTLRCKGTTQSATEEWSTMLATDSQLTAVSGMAGTTSPYVLAGDWHGCVYLVSLQGKLVSTAIMPGPVICIRHWPGHDCFLVVGHDGINDIGHGGYVCVVSLYDNYGVTNLNTTETLTFPETPMSIGLSRTGDFAYIGTYIGSIVKIFINDNDTLSIRSRWIRNLHQTVPSSGRSILAMSLPDDESMLAVAKQDAAEIYRLPEMQLIWRSPRIWPAIEWLPASKSQFVLASDNAGVVLMDIETLEHHQLGELRDSIGRCEIVQPEEAILVATHYAIRSFILPRNSQK